MQDTIKPNSIYNFGLPNVGNVKFTCVYCGAPTIAVHEIADEICCDACYLKNESLHREVDSQYRFSKVDIDDYWLNIAEYIEKTREDDQREIEKYCDGQCDKCRKSWGDGA